MRVIVAGSRSITSKHIVEETIKESGFVITEIVSGGAKGVDQLGEQIAKDGSIRIKKFIPNWKLYRGQAGFVRNTEMAQYADALIAVWDGKSKGTENMIEKAKLCKLLIYIQRVKQQHTN